MPGVDLQALPLWAHALATLVAAAGVWRGGTRLAVHAEALADRTGWSQALVGMLLLAGVTSLPELVTTVAAAGGGNAPMAANNLFGGIALQTAILVIADLTLARGPLTYFAPSPELILQGLLLVLLIALCLAFVALGEPGSFLGVGAWSATLLAAYVGAIALLRRLEGAAWRPVHVPAELGDEESGGDAADRPLPAIVRGLVGAGLLVLVCGTLVVASAEEIAARTGLGSSFVGATLLAGTTSLPEVGTTLAAVRLGAPRMAVANIFGSNAIMVALIPFADAAYRQGPLLDAVGASARVSAAAGIAVTVAYLVGLVERRDRAYLRLGIDSWAVVLLYAATLAALYAART